MGPLGTRGLAHPGNVAALIPPLGVAISPPAGLFPWRPEEKRIMPQWAPGSCPFCLGALSITLGEPRKLFQKLSEPRVTVAFWNYFWWGRGKTATPPSGS